MTERARINRPVTPREIAVIRAALERAPAAPFVFEITTNLEHLRAIGQCGCGCDSVDFVPHDPSHMSYPIADGVGTTLAGGTVGVIVWGKTDMITGLEVYGLDAAEDDLRLPVPDSIHPFAADAP